MDENARPSAGQRISAVVALLTLAFAILVVVVGVGQHLPYVFVTMFCLAVLSLAGWYVVSRAGMIRMVAAVVGMAALVAAIVVFFASDTKWWRVLAAFAAVAVAGGADVVGMAGGDGSQALIATIATKHGVPLVVIPAGTRNHFALDLGLDREDVVGSLDAFNDGVESSIDLATVNGRVFVN